MIHMLCCTLFKPHVRLIQAKRHAVHFLFAVHIDVSNDVSVTWSKNQCFTVNGKVERHLLLKREKIQTA